MWSPTLIGQEKFNVDGTATKKLNSPGIKGVPHDEGKVQVAFFLGPIAFKD